MVKHPHEIDHVKTDVKNNGVDGVVVNAPDAIVTILETVGTH